MPHPAGPSTTSRTGIKAAVVSMDAESVDQGSPQRGTRTKRQIAETQKTPASPLRRSKRLKVEDTSGRSISPAGADDVDISLRQSVKVEEEVQLASSEGDILIKREIDRFETEATINCKQQKRKRKKDPEAKAMPLAARTPGLRMFVGAHVSAAKGVFNAVVNSTHIGGNAFALFLKSQRKWENPALQDDHGDQFRRLCAEHKYDADKHVLPHGSYLVNLAQQEKAKAKQAYDSFLDDLRRCETLGITLYNFHPGSANQSSLPDALGRLAKALTNALEETSKVVPVLETMCGHGTTIGGDLQEFRDLLALIPAKHHARIGICVDTCHSHAAGYDLVTPAGFKAFMQEFDDLIGIKHLRALHLNDSRAPRGSKRDLHANIGTGFLGLRAFHNVMNEPRLEGIPMILETPIDRPRPGVGATTSQPENGTIPKLSAGCRHDQDENGEAENETDDSENSEQDLVTTTARGKTKNNQNTKTKTKIKSPSKGRPAGAKPATVADPSVWAKEIKLLESLIGVDAETDEFKTLEARLADEGKEMREKYLAQYERKLEAAEKKRIKEEEKEKEKGKAKAKTKGKTAKDEANGGSSGSRRQRSLVDMMKSTE